MTDINSVIYVDETSFNLWQKTQKLWLKNKQNDFMI